MKQYEVEFRYSDQNGRLMKGADVAQASNPEKAIAQVRANNSWKCPNIHGFRVNEIK